MFGLARIHKNVGFVGDVIFSWRLSSNPQLFSLKMLRTVIAFLLVIIIQLKTLSGFFLIVGMALASSMKFDERLSCGRRNEIILLDTKRVNIHWNIYKRIFV